MLGKDDGDGDGILEGDTEGEEVGKEDGPGDGNDVGEGDGFDDGNIVGAVLGELLTVGTDTDNAEVKMIKESNYTPLNLKGKIRNTYLLL